MSLGLYMTGAAVGGHEALPLITASFLTSHCYSFSPQNRKHLINSDFYFACVCFFPQAAIHLATAGWPQIQDLVINIIGW